MDVGGMIADLRLELNRIERSILILQMLAYPNPQKRTVPLKRGRGSPARFAGSSALSVSSRTDKVISSHEGQPAAWRCWLLRGIGYGRSVAEPARVACPDREVPERRFNFGSRTW